MRISFLGDISFNDSYIELYEKGINPFCEIANHLNNSDYVVGNLECLAKGDKGENELKKPRLSTTINTLSYLNEIRLDIACLAHNHVYDHLEDGFMKTTSFLDQSKIKYLGASIKPEKSSKPIILKENNISVGLFNYVTGDTNPCRPINTKIHVNSFNLKNCINDISKYRYMLDYVVLILHWGGKVEGGLYPDWHQPRLARTLIDNGADLIIGHHSHTIQPVEIYKGKYIFYSIGNFCFSDYWFNGEFHPMPKRRMITNIVTINLNKTDYKVNTSFYQNTRTSFTQLNRYQNKFILRNFLFKIILRIKIIWFFYYTYLKFIYPVLAFFGRSDLSLTIKFKRFLKYIKKTISSSRSYERK